MTHSNKRNSFIRIAAAACQVRLTLKSGHTECCQVQLDAAEPLVDDLVLQLIWGNQGRCHTIITEKGIADGNWVGDSFHCNNS